MDVKGRLEFLLRLNDALRPLSDPSDVQEMAARLLGEHLSVNRAGYAEIEGRDYVIRREYVRGVAPLVGQGPRGTFGVALQADYRRGEPVLVNDVQTDPRFTDAERDNLRAKQIAAFIGVTLLKEGRIVAAFGVNNATPREWTDTEAELIRDVAERTWDAVERTRAEAALREREQRLRVALEASAGGSWTFDAVSGRVDWDHGFRARYGFDADQPPSFEGWLSRVHEDDRSRLLVTLDEVQRTQDAWENTFRIVWPDGTIRWIQSRGRAERDASGQVARLTGLELDVTERRRIEEAVQARRNEEYDTERQQAAAALQERTLQLEHRMAQLSRLTSDLTLAEQQAREQLAKTLHDGLQQMLLVASLNLEQQMKRDADRGAAAIEPMAVAKKQIDEAINAARSLSFELSPPLLQSSGLPAAITWLAEWTQNKYGIQVQVSTDSRANSPRKDVRTLLFESVRELLFNVVKHAQVDRVAVDLAVGHDDTLCITVCDHGIGFDPSGLNDPLNAGIGWGLFSIRDRLTLLGGRFDIESAPGQGSCFRLIAPRAGARESAAAQDTLDAPAAERTAAGHDGNRALRILIVDDHAAVRSVLCEMLQEQPVLRVVGDASNGFEAIEQAHSLQPDVVLMDVSMPHMDGIEATARLRAELPAITILGLSMQPGDEGPHPIEEAGAAGFFTKGGDTRRLIDHLLAMHAARTRRPPVDQAS